MSLIEVNSLCKNYKIADKEQGCKFRFTGVRISLEPV